MVLSTITQTASEVLEIRLAGQDAPLRPTANHRLFSATRNDWVRAGDLVAGEELETRTGTARVESVLTREGAIRVYNLEVETDHCYYTGEARVLSHNTCAQDAGKWLSPDEYISTIKGELYDEVKHTLRNLEQGQHGVIDKRVGNRLVQKANELKKQGALPEIIEQMRAEGQRLINRGGSISHKNQ